MITSADITNRALNLIAGQAVVAGVVPNLTGGGNASTAANNLYPGVVATVLREQDWEFARRAAVPLVLDGNAGPAPWPFEYIYPSDCVRLLQVQPTTTNVNDPQAVRWEVADVTVANNPAKAILTNIPAALATYTSNSADENHWDAVFQEAVVRMLASELAMSIGGRPDFSEHLLTTAGSVISAGGGRDS